MNLGLQGRVAVVAASSRGLGRAAAEALAGEGAAVVVNGRNRESLAEVEAQLNANGGDVLVVPGDLDSPSTPGQLIEAALERFGRLDVVVANNHGPAPGRALDVSDSQLMEAFNSNMLATVRLVDAAMPALRAGGYGRICAIASHSVVQPIPGLALSNVARTGLWAWVKTAANDLRGSGVTINLACPGTHKTERMAELGLTDELAGEPADFGKVVAFLCSEPAAFINGAAIVVNGGESLAL